MIGLLFKGPSDSNSNEPHTLLRHFQVFIRAPIFGQILLTRLLHFKASQQQKKFINTIKINISLYALIKQFKIISGAH